MKKEAINILISIDDKYVEHAEDLIYSINEFNDVYINLFLIYDDSLSKMNIDRISNFLAKNDYGKLYDIYFANNIDSTMKKIEYISLNTYFRLFAPFLLKEKFNIDRVLYLDCDIICNGDIIEFYNTNFDDNIIVGCKNMLKEELKLWTLTLNINLDLPLDHQYINAGVLLINIEKYIRSITYDGVYKFLETNKDQLLLQDQDAINKLFHGKIKVVSSIYNYQINPSEEDYEKLDIRLVHYSEEGKPWKLDYENFDKAIYYYKLLKNRNKKDKLKNLIYTQYENAAKKLYNEIVSNKDL